MGNLLANLNIARVFVTQRQREQDNTVTKEQISQARTLLESVVHDVPSSAPAHRLLGLLHQQNEDYDVADQYYKKLVSLQPNDSSSHYLYGVSLSIQADKLSRFEGSDTTLTYRTRSKSVNHLQQATWLLQQQENSNMDTAVVGKKGTQKNINSKTKVVSDNDITPSTIHYTLGVTLSKQGR